MRLLPTAALLASLCLLNGATQAQHLLGLDDGAGALVPPRIHEFQRDCQALRICDAVGMGDPIADPAGGIAKGACTGWTYTTDGPMVVAHDDGCNAVWRCPLPQIAAGGWTGLDVDEDRDRLYFTDALHVGWYHFDGSCPIGQLGHACRLPAGLNAPLTGVALDPRDDSVWVCDGSGQVANVVFSRTGACTLRRIFRVVCPNQTSTLSLRGITLDACNDVLFVTDDQGTLATVTTGGAVLRCCRYQRVQPSRRLVGLAREPAGATSIGRGCTGRNCPPCSPKASLRGLPVLPSRCFGFQLEDAPSNGRAILMLNVGGPCSTIPVGGLCGPLTIGVPNWFSPMQPIAPSGPGSCDGVASLQVPLPNDHFLCGLQICAQWLVICPSGDLGLSDGLDFRLN